MLTLGDTVLIPKPGHDKSHLWVLLTAVNPQTGEVIIVNFTTQRPHSDTTVVIQIGEHRFVDRPTVVFYSDARFTRLAALEAAVNQGIASRHDPLKPALLTRVQEGLLKSPFTPAKIRTAFAEAQQQGLA
jgi:hypothetical protein